MLNEKFLVEFLRKLEGLRGDQFEDVHDLIHLAWKCKDDSEEGNKEQIAKTLLEVMEPERIGKVKFR